MNNVIHSASASSHPVVQVEIRDGKLTVTSRQVAAAFGKEHKEVLRDIRNLSISQDFTQRNFARGIYRDSTGRSLPMYILTRDGFMILAMGYTGYHAMILKEAYITEFNRMEAQLQSGLSLPDFTNPVEAARAWIVEYEAKEEARKQLAVAEPKAAVYDAAVAGKRMSVTTFARKLRGVNVNVVKRDLRILGYLYKFNNTYRVYARYRDVLFEEKIKPLGVFDIMILDQGKQLLVKLYKERRLTMKKSFQGALHVVS